MGRKYCLESWTNQWR